MKFILTSNTTDEAKLKIELEAFGRMLRFKWFSRNYEKEFNLTREERRALFDLKNEKTMVIKGADKGSAVVVWDRDDYIQEAEKQLGDKEIYEEVSNDPQFT